MNNTTPFVRDVVLPLVEVKAGSQGLEMTSFCGSAFLIGSRGVALTVAHLLVDLPDAEHYALMTVDANAWVAHGVVSWEKHPTEDVAVLKLQEPIGSSWLQLAGVWHGQTAPYRQFGYPSDVLHEVVKEGHAQPRPDLVYTQGYIRRRISGIPIPGIRGEGFFELSEVAGAGCSGSPVMLITSGPAWLVIGIYVGQRITGGDDLVRVGYAVREDMFRDWVPDLLGVSVIEESRSSP
jgi:hypothetical protein